MSWSLQLERILLLLAFRWKDNIAEAVLECASLGKVPDYPVPVDDAIMESLPQLAVSKVTSIS